MKIRGLIINYIWIWYCIIIFFSCEKEKDNNTKITDIERLNGTEYLVKAENDSFLIKGYYKSIDLPLDSLSKEHTFYFLETKGKLIKKEFYDKESKYCIWLENYDTGIEGVVEYISFYPSKVSGNAKSIVFSDNNETFFEETYDEKGRIIETTTDFYFEVDNLISDSVCITIKQPGWKYLDCTFSYLADVNYSQSNTFKLEDITIDSIQGIGKICFSNKEKVELVYFVGDVHFYFRKAKPQLLQFVKKIRIH